MKKLRRLFLIPLILIIFLFGSCAQDETMDDIIDNAEISTPSDPKDGSDSDNPGDG